MRAFELALDQAHRTIAERRLALSQPG
jgi:hypothetical protein